MTMLAKGLREKEREGGGGTDDDVGEGAEGEREGGEEWYR